MQYSLMFKSIKIALLDTYRKVHIVPIIITSLLMCTNKFILKDNSIEFDIEDIATYLNGLSILSTFFIFSIQGIDFKYINETYKDTIEMKHLFSSTRYTITQANQLRYTCYSLSIVSFALIFLVYILLYLKLFENTIGWLFLFTIIYIFNALIFTLSIWNATNNKRSKD